MLRIISERSLDSDEELCACFMDGQKACDRVKWTKSMEILKNNSVDWRQRRVINKLYMGHRVKVRLDKDDTRSVKRLEEELDNGAVCHRFCPTCTSKYLIKEALERFGDFEIGGSVIHIVKYGDYLVLLAEKEVVLQSLFYRQMVIGRCYRMERNVENSNVHLSFVLRSSCIPEKRA
jgi:hypothetical protein